MSSTAVHATISHHLKRLKSLCETDNGPKNKTTGIPKPVTESLNYTKLEDRLKSFVNWPNKQIEKETLAEAGFFYKNHDDVVQCPFCLIEGYQWVAGDNPMEDHRKWSPNCPFVTNSVEHDLASDGASNRSLDTCGLYGVAVLPNSVPEDDRTLHLERLGIQKNQGPKYPDKFSYESRLRTFADWPKSIKQTPQELAKAGFFYIGVGDQTLCFHCGVGLKDWEVNDDPWEQHALWLPKCNFVFLTKGQDYIEQVKLKKEPQLSNPGTSSSSVETKEESTETLSVNKCEKTSEGKETEEKTLCKICFKNELGVVFLPCGHIVSCVECSAALKNCAVCRKPLEASIRAFLS